MVYIQLPFPVVIRTFCAVSFVFDIRGYIACNVISHIFPIKVLRDIFFILIDFQVA